MSTEKSDIEDKLKYIHAEAHKIWSGKDSERQHVSSEVFDFQEVYRHWKKMYLPKKLSGDTQLFKNNSNAKLSELIEKWVDELLSKSLENFLFDVFIDCSPKADVDKTKAMLKLIIEDNKNLINDQKRELVNVLSGDFVFASELNDKIFPFLDSIINICIAYIAFQGKEDDCFYAKKIKLIHHHDLTVDYFSTIRDQIWIFVAYEFWYSIKKLCTRKERIIKASCKDKIARLILPSYFSDISREIKNEMKQKGKKWIDAIKPYKEKLIPKKIEEIMQKIQEWMAGIGENDQTILINSDLVNYLFQSKKDKFQIKVDDTDPLETFLIAFLKKAEYDDITFLQIDEDMKKLYVNQFSQKLYDRFDQCLPKVRPVLVPMRADKISSWVPPKFDYITFFPANYRFPIIENIQQLFAAFKLVQRSMKRYFKYLVGKKLLNPYISILEIEKWHDSLKRKLWLLQNDDFFMMGDKPIFNFDLGDITSICVWFEIENSGVMDPRLQDFGTYSNGIKKLTLFKQQMKKYINDDEKIDQIIIKTLYELLLFLPSSELSENIPDLFLLQNLQKFLIELAICLFVIESVRNKGSLFTHPLVFNAVMERRLRLEDVFDELNNRTDVSGKTNESIEDDDKQNINENNSLREDNIIDGEVNNVVLDKEQVNVNAEEDELADANLDEENQEEIAEDELDSDETSNDISLATNLLPSSTPVKSKSLPLLKVKQSISLPVTPVNHNSADDIKISQSEPKPLNVSGLNRTIFPMTPPLSASSGRWVHKKHAHLSKDFLGSGSRSKATPVEQRETRSLESYTKETAKLVVTDFWKGKLSVLPKKDVQKKAKLAFDAINNKSPQEVDPNELAIESIDLNANSKKGNLQPHNKS